MTLAQILSLARQIRDTLRDGLNRAFRYLRALRIRAEVQCWALLGV